MNNIKWYKVFKYWMIGLFILDIFWYGYLIIANRIYTGAVFNDWMAVMTYFILGLSAVLIVTNIVTSIQDKRYTALGYGVAILAGGFLLFMAMMLTVLSTIF